jgi:hypothetical protein
MKTLSLILLALSFVSCREKIVEVPVEVPTYANLKFTFFSAALTADDISEFKLYIYGQVTNPNNFPIAPIHTRLSLYWDYDSARALGKPFAEVTGLLGHRDYPWASLLDTSSVLMPGQSLDHITSSGWLPEASETVYYQFSFEIGGQNFQPSPVDVQKINISDVVNPSLMVRQQLKLDRSRR